MLSKTLVSTLVVLGAAAYAAPAQAVNYVVQNKNDAGAGSLRDAINQANASAGVVDEIHFNIPGAGPNLHVIHLASDLPTVIDDQIDIRGYSQPGAVKAAAGAPAVMKIVLDSSQVANGLVVEADDTLIRGLVVHTAGTVAGDGVGVRVVGSGNRLEGNYVGLDGFHNDTFTHGNLGDGVQVEGNDNMVGGNTPEDRNVISANGKIAGTDADGVSIIGDDNKVKGNAIGTDPLSTTGQIGNDGAGVRVEGNGNLVGGSAFAANVISGNGTGVVVASGEDNAIEGNLIGTDGTGEVDLGNSLGVSIESPRNVVGGDQLFDGNVIAGSTGDGVALLSDWNTVESNKIGTDVWGEDALPNASGIRVTGLGNVIGGSNGYAGNVVSGNLFDGIKIEQPSGFAPYGTSVLDNYIGTAVNGTDPLPNGDDGISIINGGSSTIGAVDPEYGNVIAFNGGDGVNVVAGAGNSIIGNSIVENDDLGIDLADDDVTVNDANDVDNGANSLQNHPEITGAGTTTVDWALDGRPFTHYRIELYGNGSSCDGSGHGEGETFLGSTYAWTDSLGEVEDTTALTTAAAVGDLVTATATVDVTLQPAPGQLPSPGPQPIPSPIPLQLGPAATSEFSPCVPVT